VHADVTLTRAKVKVKTLTRAKVKVKRSRAFEPSENCRSHACWHRHRRHCVTWGSTFPPPKMAQQPPPILGPCLLWPGQTAQWIKMPHDLEVGLGPGHIVLDGDPASHPKNWAQPPFLANVCCGQMAGWINMPLSTEVGLGPSHTVLHGDPAPRPRRGTPPNFRPMSVVVKLLGGSRCHLVRRYASVQATLC